MRRFVRRIAENKTAWALAISLATVGMSQAGSESRTPARKPNSAPALTSDPMSVSSVPEQQSPIRQVDGTTPAPLAIDPPSTPNALPLTTGATLPNYSPVPVYTPPEPIGPAASPVPGSAGTPCDNCAAGAKAENRWAKIPPVAVFPRPGYFTIPGSGRGYYSFLDVIQGNVRDKAPIYPYLPFALKVPSSFDADFRYLENPENTQHDFFDPLKRIHIQDDWLLILGGQHSLRYMSEENSRLGKKDNEYLLNRNRVHADLWYHDDFRIFTEVIMAYSFYNDLAKLNTDENHFDFLNLFFDLKLATIAENPLYVRAGRQELLYGSQRLLSPSDWANTRRTFQGVKAFWHSEKLDVDAFWTDPVIINARELDPINKHQNFWGTWLTYRPKKGTAFDLYYLGLKNEDKDPDPRVTGMNGKRGGLDVHTFGSRISGNENQFLYDFEGMLQTGTFINQNHFATAYTAGLGYEFRNIAWRPQLWVYNDYASGTSNSKGTDHHTFQQLFSFGHYYLGYTDFVGRQNINDLSLQLAFFPDNWITTLVQYHNYRLAEKRDFLYNASGRPTRHSADGSAGNDVGNNVDFLVNFHLTTHQDFLLGYSKFFAGDFIKKTGAPVNSDLFYLMYNYRW